MTKAREYSIGQRLARPNHNQGERVPFETAHGLERLYSGGDNNEERTWRDAPGFSSR